MKKHLVYSVTVVLMGLMAIIGVEESHSQELLVKNCSELITMAQTLEADLKTVDTVLGSAIQAGNMLQIRKYKLKRAAVQKDLNSVFPRLTSSHAQRASNKSHVTRLIHVLRRRPSMIIRQVNLRARVSLIPVDIKLEGYFCHSATLTVFSLNLPCGVFG